MFEKSKSCVKIILTFLDNLTTLKILFSVSVAEQYRIEILINKFYWHIIDSRSSDAF